jgi:hypothetical protein
MGRGFVRAALGLLLAAAMSACAVSEQHRMRNRELLTRRIVDDAIAYNEAYNSAITGQILLNILRAYNRQPRQYTSMSGFTNEEAPDSSTTTVAIGSLPLGELGEEWGEGALGLGLQSQLEPGYKVEPFSTDAFSNIALRPTPTIVFQYYWENGWNRDLLLFLLVDQMTISGSPPTTLYNSAGTIARNCEGADYAVGGCAFVRRVRALREELRNLNAVAPPAQTGGACYPIASYNVRSAPVIVPAPRRGAEAPPCPVTIVVGATRYTLRLRSLDDVVYYVGELLRADGLHPPPEGALEARLHVIASGSYDEMAPLFRVVRADRDTERQYAATVTYAGGRYSAGQPEAWFCYDPRGPRHCRSPGGDRSGTVLELLVGILAHNQSEVAVRAPQGALVRQ